MEYEELAEKIIGCAYRVYNRVGFGFLESVYEKCLMIELGKAGLRAEGPVHPVILSKRKTSPNLRIRALSIHSPSFKGSAIHSTWVAPGCPSRDKSV